MDSRVITFILLISKYICCEWWVDFVLYWTILLIAHSCSKVTLKSGMEKAYFLSKVSTQNLLPWRNPIVGNSKQNSVKKLVPILIFWLIASWQKGLLFCKIHDTERSQNKNINHLKYVKSWSRFIKFEGKKRMKHLKRFKVFKDSNLLGVKHTVQFINKNIQTVCTIS